MEWLTDNKIPIGKWAEAVFDWLQINGAFFFDALSDFLEALIDGILWVLQTPPPLLSELFPSNRVPSIARSLAASPPPPCSKELNAP